MGRRRARRTALQVLFAVDLTGQDPRAAFEETVELVGTPEPDRQFAWELVAGVVAHRAFLDAVIKKYSEQWQLERLACVDRNILRLALYEIFFREDIPNAVGANEAVELAKRFGGPDSGRFINGILGRVLGEGPRPDFA
ncbi:MAG: transcription antitermination factor NusB [Firmicutes bacterium]|nr:transcription antitermination factor NusB [Bacillota bacterium]